VDDEPQVLLSSSVTLSSAGIKDILTAEDGRQVIPLLAKHDVCVVVLDLTMPHISGTELLSEIARDFPHIKVIMMTATNELETAVECMKAGSIDYLVKPVEKNRFVSSVQRALELCALSDEVSSLKEHLLRDHLEHGEAFSSIITQSKRMRSVFQYVESISSSRQPVLIVGETGVGKELMARAVHSISGVKGTFVAVDLAGLDDTMFSDTLFGHKRGAYTGALEEREGLIARASGGTLFLDEIGDLNEQSQVKLLRLLQEHTYYPLGSDIPRRSDARVIVATNKDLQKLISEGAFRKDLYYRLRAHQVQIPPLRERKEDMPLLLRYFLESASRALKRKNPTPPAELVTLLCTYHFPGNVRELQAMVFDAVARHRTGKLSMDSFKEIIGQELSSAALSPPELLPCVSERLPTLKEAEQYLISSALTRSNGNQGIAASLLGITRQALNKRLMRSDRYK
jgi:two-component system response regulator HydG